MPLTKARGQMYPWVDYLKNCVGGGCPHACIYCCVSKMGKRFPAVKRKYSGKPFLIKSELKEDLYRFGEGVTIFVQNNGDLFADSIPSEWIERILTHYREYPKNTYLFQTKNPRRFAEFITEFPPNTILGTTLETNADVMGMSQAPPIIDRVLAMDKLNFRKMVSIEPIVEFKVSELVMMVKGIKPEFVSIGADSKNSNLLEPSPEKVKALIEELKMFTEVRIKDNLRKRGLLA